jgi:hypothetical protein
MAALNAGIARFFKLPGECTTIEDLLVPTD